jgi:hypothetical protein
MNGSQFVYKEPRGKILPEVVDRLKNQFKIQFGENTEVQVLPNTADDIDISKLEPNKCYFQVISLQPYFAPEKVKGGMSKFEQWFCIGRKFGEISKIIEKICQKRKFGKKKSWKKITKKMKEKKNFFLC